MVREEDEKLLEFKLTEPEIAVRLVEKTARKRDEHLRLLLDMRRRARRIREVVGEDFVKSILFNPREDIHRYGSRPLAGVDGSFQVVGGYGNLYYVMLTAVIVELRRGVFSKQGDIMVHYPENGIDVVSFNDPTMGEKTIEIAEDIMMYYETNAVHELNRWCREEGRCYTAFIDGPIVDPPREQVPETLGIVEKIYGRRIDYIRLRVDTMRDSWSLRGKGHTVLGYVKSIRSESNLRETLSRQGVDRELLDRFSGDAELAYMLMIDTTTPHPSRDIDVYPYIGPFRGKGGVYDTYAEKGLHIYYIYGLNRLKNNVFRLEIGIPAEEDIDKTRIREMLEEYYQVTLATTLPGNRHPLPVVLAHEKCRIRRGAAEYIYELILSGLYRELLAKDTSNWTIYHNLLSDKSAKA